MRPRVACDTNVLVSALISQGPPSRVLEVAITGRIDLLVPEHALHELSRVLETKLGFSSKQTGDAIELIKVVATECLQTPPSADPLSGDPDDDLIVASALRAGAEVLVTGDRQHLLPLGQVNEMRILTPQALLAELVADARA